jgi:CDP-glucose 4,6-dehydratase
MKPGFWKDRRVLVTGHTGFIGSWLSLWLNSLGARTTGIALDPPTQPNMFGTCRVASRLIDVRMDVRDREGIAQEIEKAQPDLIFHLAAQPLVRAGYADPIGTYATNVMGTANVLDAARRLRQSPAVVIFTSDKCYENLETDRPYVERDPLGGHDPYSSSKACAEIVTSAFRRSFASQGTDRIATVRAGNVIGGGDWAADRLLPDFMRAVSSDQSLAIRNPSAVRPWQHVLEPLRGCLQLAEKLADEGGRFADAWNFGPDSGGACTVEEVIRLAALSWGPGATWQADRGPHPHEAGQLRVDAGKARERLGWQPRWPLQRAVDRTVAWYKADLSGQDMEEFTLRQIAEYSEIVSG